MDLQEKYNQLTKLLDEFMKNEVTVNEMQSFAWDVIEYFTDTPSEELPKVENFEDIFWHAIWTIQHVCDEEHESDGICNREVPKLLSYLKQDEKMPKECIGQRP